MNIHHFYEQRNNFFLKTSQTMRGGLTLFILIGLVTLIGGILAGEATRTWGSFLFNVFFFFSIALGGVAFSGMQDVIGAVWGRPVMRLHESFSSFLPAALVFFLVFFTCIVLKVGGAQDVFIWIRNPEMLDHFWGKKTWLQPGFMIIRDLFCLVVILFLAIWQMKKKLGPDMMLVRGNKEKAMEMGLNSKTKLRYWSAPILVVYAITFSLLAFDLTMSLSPLWFSTLWGGWSFAVMMQTLMASTLIFMFWLKSSNFGQYFRQQQFHDVGKLMHGFTIFFAYLTYAHVLTYWYGNMPEETEYFIHRLHGPWLFFVIVCPILVFVVPLFGLIPKASKWTPGLTIPLALIILLAQWMTALLVVIPEVANAATWKFPLIEMGAFFGVLGVFLSCVFSFAKRFPMLAIADPLLPEALSDGHH